MSLAQNVIDCSSKPNEEYHCGSACQNICKIINVKSNDACCGYARDCFGKCIRENSPACVALYPKWNNKYSIQFDVIDSFINKFSIITHLNEHFIVKYRWICWNKPVFFAYKKNRYIFIFLSVFRKIVVRIKMLCPACILGIRNFVLFFFHYFQVIYNQQCQRGVRGG